MKRLFCTFIVGVLLLGCSSQDDIMERFNTNGPEFPTHIEKYGKELAKSIKQTVAILNKQGVDYSDANYSKDFHDKFYKDWLNASPSATKSKTTIEQLEVDPLVLVEKYRNLTPVQLKFIDRIINEGSKSDSYEEFCAIIKGINSDINHEVPKIEQERLLHITSALYYGLSEVYHLQKQGQMLITPQTNLQLSMVKTRSESGGGGIWETCRQIFETTCNYVVGMSPYYAGEVVTSISTTILSGAVVFVVVLCMSNGDTDFCESFASKCSDKKWKYENGSWIRMDCTVCYSFCKQNGHWNHSACPLY